MAVEISVKGTSAIEDGNSDLIYEVSLSEPASATVAVSFRTPSNYPVDAGNDYRPKDGIITFAPGETFKTIAIDIRGDSDDESDDAVVLELFDPINAGFVGDAVVLRETAFILDQDGLGSNLALSVSDPVVRERDNGSTVAAFKIKLSQASTFPIKLDYATIDGTALAGKDYNAKSGSVSFSPGQTEATVEVEVLSDDIAESAEFFNLAIAPTSQIANGADGAVGKATILDDDAPQDLPSISIEGDSSYETAYSKNVEFVVSLSSPSTETVSFDWRVTGGTATSGSDYSPNTDYRGATATFAPGETQKRIYVNPWNDSSDEADETIIFEAFQPVNAILGAGVSILREKAIIWDNDGLSSDRIVSIDDVEVIEDTEQSSFVAFTARLSRPNDTEMRFDYSTADGTATAGQDYVASSGQLVFAPGQTEAVVFVEIRGDYAAEASETFTLSLDTPFPFGLSPLFAGASATATIVDDEIVGTEGPDVLSGTPQADGIHGLDGNDVLLGLAGNDRLYGGPGADTLSGGLGTDVYNGGDGIDTADFRGTTPVSVLLSLAGAQATGFGSDTFISIENILGSSLADTLAGNAAANRLAGGDGNDKIDGEAGADTLLGEDGEDTIEGGAGNDSIDGGAQDDALAGGMGDDRVFGGIGSDMIDGGEGADQLDGAFGDDTVRGNAGNDTLAGGEGRDSLNGGTENDSLSGGNGNDLVEGGDGADTLRGDDGNDTLDGGDGADMADFSGPRAVTISLSATGAQVTGYGNDTLISIENVRGSAGNDEITGNAEDNVLFGGAGDDELEGRDGNDTLNGEFGADDLSGDAGDDELNGGADNDKLAGEEGADTLFGGSGDDELEGDEDDDVLDGGIGNDLLEGGDGDDELSGGGGRDQLFGNLGDDALAGGALKDLLEGGEGDDTLAGGTGKDNLIGDEGNDVVSGGGGKDKIDGGIGDDDQRGDAGDDRILANAGNDTLDGGSGVDWVDFRGNVAVTISLAETGAQDTGYGMDTLVRIENVLGGDAGDALTGDGVGNLLLGRDGKDTLDGGAGEDVLDGGRGRDVLTGGSDDDVLKGGSQGDTLSGDDGDDDLLGGAGSDELNGGDGEDTVEGGGGRDSISGGDDDDVLSGGGGSDTIEGGEGDDTMEGGGSGDVFVFDLTGVRDLGEDVIELFDATEDSMVFVGVSPEDIAATTTRGDTVINYTGGEIVLPGQNLVLEDLDVSFL